MSLSKTLYLLLSIGSTQQDPPKHDRKMTIKIVEWDVKNEQTSKISALIRVGVLFGFVFTLSFMNIHAKLHPL